jgi:DNA-binding transcriptional MerR regulator
MASKPKHTSPDQFRDVERLPLMIAMRIKGESLDAIGAAVGLSRSRTCEVLKRALEERAKLLESAVETLRSIECERLDRAQLVADRIMHNEPEPRADGKPAKRRQKPSPDRQLKAIAAYVKIMERRAKLLGLDLGKEDVSGGAKAAIAEFLASAARSLDKVYGDDDDGDADGDRGVREGGEAGGLPEKPD